MGPRNRLHHDHLLRLSAPSADRGRVGSSPDRGIRGSCSPPNPQLWPLSPHRATSKLGLDCLVLELTESALVHDIDRAILKIDELRSVGVRLAIDDFGTGFSSLAYLRSLPIDILKIDRSFITALGHGPEDAALVRAVLHLGATFKLEVIAEGIETLEQLEQLREMGCGLGQGFHFARPVSPEAIPAFAERLAVPA